MYLCSYSTHTHTSKCNKKEDDEMNCPDDDFVFQQQKTVFRRLPKFFFFFLLFALVLFFALFFLSLSLYVSSLQTSLPICAPRLLNKYKSERIHETILDETAHRRRDDDDDDAGVFAPSFFLSFSLFQIKPQAKL